MKYIVQTLFICQLVCLMQVIGQAQDTLPKGYFLNSQMNNPFFSVAVYKESIDELQRPVTIKVVEVPRIQVLKEIALQGGLGLAVNDEWPSLKTAITLELENVSLAEGLELALSGTEYEALITRRREIVLAKKEEALPEKPYEADQRPGIIHGEVRDGSTGETLPGANVVLKGTTTGVATDVDGRYVFRRFPAGLNTLEVRYLGYATKEISVTLSEEERLELHIELTPDMIEGDEIFVVAQQRGQARALTRQRESANIRTVISSEQIDRFADQTIEGALQRVAGMGHGGTNIRGAGSAASNVTMDGQRMGSTGTAGREVDLSTISADMVQELEVIKVITPDLDADAMSGVINIRMRRPIGGDRNMNVRFGGGLDPKFVGLVGPESRASISYGDSPSDRFSYGVNLSYQRGTSTSERVGISWGYRVFDGVPHDVLSGLNLRLSMGHTERYGTALQLTFQPTDRTTFHVQNMFNYQDRHRQTHTNDYNIETSRYITPNITGDRPTAQSPGHISYFPVLNVRDIYQYNKRLGVRHRFDRIDVEYHLDWGHGRYYSDNYDIRFRNMRVLDVEVDIEDRWDPMIVFLGRHDGMPQEWPAPADLGDGRIRHGIQRHVDNDFKGSIDLEAPFHNGSFKTGASAIMTFKNGSGYEYLRNYSRSTGAGVFDMIPNTSWQIFDKIHPTYNMPYLVDLYKAREFYYSHLPGFYNDHEHWSENYERNNYYAHEKIYAGYGMATINILSRLKFLGGMRVEHSRTRYDGKKSLYSASGDFRGAVDVSNTNNYTYLFPNAQIVYGFRRFTQGRLAYSRSIGRPSFSELSSAQTINYESQRITTGNPKLRPMTSNNLDLLFEHYFMNVGQFTVGLFYKDMRDFVYSFTEFIDFESGIEEGSEVSESGFADPQFDGWEFRSRRNGDQAIIYGLEVSWQQNLDFLPGFLGNLGTYATYSYAYSETEIDQRIAPVRLRGQRPHVINGSLAYNQGGFSGQISYQWAADVISSYGNRRHTPGIPGHDIERPVYFDRFNDARNDLSMTLRYRLTSRFRIWVDANNLLNARSISYFYNRNYYPNDITLSRRTFTMGVRYGF